MADKIIRLTRDIQIVGNFVNTRNGFRHEATVFKGNSRIGFAKVNYLNRTWEKYSYQTVFIDAIKKSSIDSKSKKRYIKMLTDGRY